MTGTQLLGWNGRNDDVSEKSNVHLAGGPVREPTTVNDFILRIEAAANGQHGASQQRIAQVGIQWLMTLLDKNQDYGNSAWEQPILAPHVGVGDALLCRMSDKVRRIGTLAMGKDPRVQESLEDTVNDLGAYCLLWLARPMGMATLPDA